MKVSLEKPGTLEVTVFLAHHGILGMKWGHRKETDLGGGGGGSTKPQLSDRKLKRAQGHEQYAAKLQTEIDKINANPSKFRIVQYNRNARVKELEKVRDTHIKAAKDIRAGKLTDFQRHALIGAGATAAVLAAYGTYKLADSGTLNQLAMEHIPIRTNKLLSRTMTPDEIFKDVVRDINPGYGGFGTKMNCRRCTFAYELRRRGMDVRATRTHSGYGQNIAGLLNALDPHSDLPTSKFGIIRTMMQEHFQAEKQGKTALEIGRLTKGSLFFEEGVGRHLISETDFSTLTPSAKAVKIFEGLAKNPPGARGELGMRWRFGGAHSMAWEIIDGKPVIFDTQSGHIYKSIEEFAKHAGAMHSCAYTRLDNIDLNMKYLLRWVRNV